MGRLVEDMARFKADVAEFQRYLAENIQDKESSMPYSEVPSHPSEKPEVPKEVYVPGTSAQVVRYDEEGKPINTEEDATMVRHRDRLRRERRKKEDLAKAMMDSEGSCCARANALMTYMSEFHEIDLEALDCCGQHGICRMIEQDIGLFAEILEEKD